MKSDLEVTLSVCICTWRRERMLARALGSILEQDYDRAFEVVVVDNDAGESARGVVEAFGEVAGCRGLEVRYVVEPQRGISHARNRALRMAQADWVAFLDDDEQATPGWLTAATNAVRDYGAEAVFGPVLPVFSSDFSPRLRRARLYRPVRLRSGSLVTWEAKTGNCLFNKTSAAQWQLTFDPNLALVGGEDIDFFVRFKEQGARMTWCDEAIVLEQWTAERATARWQVIRGFRAGWVWAYTKLHTTPPGWRPKFQLAVRAVLGAVKVLMLSLSELSNPRGATLLWLNGTAAAVGKACCLLGVEPLEEYRLRMPQK